MLMVFDLWQVCKVWEE